VSTANTGDATVTLSGPSGTQRLTTVPRLLANGVNGTGTIIGNVQNDVDTDGYVIDKGVTTRLGKPANALNVRANAINDAGDVVGDARMPGGKFRAVVWRSGKWSQPQFLPAPAGGQSDAIDIAADGRIVGSIGNDAQPYLWRVDGTGQVLPTPPGKPGGLAGHVAGDWAIGPVDYLAGTTVKANGRREPTALLPWARWNLRTGEVQEIQAGQRSMGAPGLLHDGTVVVNTPQGTVLWRDAGTTKLPAPAGYDSMQVTAVAGNGLLVGTAADPGGTFAAFRWNCG
jgi:uncharacterized membrane protein